MPNSSVKLQMGAPRKSVLEAGSVSGALTSISLSEFGALCLIVATEIGSTTFSNAAELKLVFQLLGIAGIVLDRLFAGAPTYRWFALVVPLAIVLWSALLSNDRTILWLAILVSAADRIRQRRLAGMVGVATVIVVVLSALGSILGFANDVILMRSGQALARHSLGFAHPNRLGMMMLVVAVMVVITGGVLARSTVTVLLLSCFAVANWIADSRTSAIGILLVLFIGLLSANGARIFPKPAATTAVISAGTISVGVTLFAAIRFSPGDPIWNLVNTLSSDRAYLINYYFQLSGVSIGGRDLEGIRTLHSSGFVTNELLLDNAVGRLVLVHGIAVAAVVVIYLIGFVAQLLVMPQLRYQVLIIAALLLVGIGESVVLEVGLAGVLSAAVPWQSDRSSRGPSLALASRGGR